MTFRATWSWRAALVAVCAAGVLLPRAAGAAEVPAFTAPVVDEANVVPDDLEASLNSELTDYQARSGNQIAVAVVRTTGTDSIEEYSLALANAWGVGDADLDNGVVLVIAYDDHALRIEVGSGLESLLTRDLAALIISDAITPSLQSDDVAGGIGAGITAIETALDGEPVDIQQDSSSNAAPPAATEPYSGSSGNGGSSGPGFGAFGFVIVFMFVAAMMGGIKGQRRRSGWTSPVGFGNSWNDNSWNNSSWSDNRSFGGGGIGSSGSSGGGHSGGGHSSGGGGGGGGGSFGGGGASGKW